MAGQPEIIFKKPNELQPIDPRVEAVGRKFMELLFAKPADGSLYTSETHPLREIVAPNFQEKLDGHVTLNGYEALIAYRARFGGPTLRRAHMLAAPPHRGYNFSTLTEFTFNLPSGAPQFDTRVRMWESLDIRPSADDPDRLVVHGRTYQPIGAAGLLDTVDGQHAFVDAQVQHFVAQGSTMPMDPWEEVYARTFPGMHFAE